MSENSGSAPSRTTDSASPVRVGVLSFHNSKETKAILNAVHALGHEPVWLREENARSWIEAGNLRFDPDVEVVSNRLLTTKAAQPLDDLGIATSYAASCPVLNPPAVVVQAMHKYGAAATLTAAGIPVPDAYMAFTHRTINEGNRLTSEKAVHKSAIGTNGARMSIVGADDTVSPHIAHRRAFLQEFIDTGTERPFDVRAYVVDDRIVGAMKRYAPPDEWRTNVAVGAEVEDFTADLPEEAARLSREAADVLDLDYAGVDLLCRDGAWYVLEVNATAGFKGLFEATGTSPAPFIAGLAIERGGGRVDLDRVTDLAAELDDSTPECKPSIDPEPTESAAIGYTERVTVGAGGRTIDAIAKSDTGARRTSIDLDVAADIGAGPIVGTVHVKSGSQTGRQKRPLVEIDVKIGDRWQTVTASIENRNHMAYPILLGRDILDGYRVDVTKRQRGE
ncbi:putative ATP-dependent zinc protease [Halorubrum lacusprofundi]|uniref:RimK domain protein ATP-grasp n=1 Tax=Halorubrum lacusprofundi (strain ATCC 49239 / DSM 5036 / JCM 8891 / ACAM 34) TaxID=416348 RepID=B9LTA8_HALLT|nr:RimK/LysX family protein [Halorubrum lacusprofundi]ACM58080.1 RimK domain protein ATP-grasp [Halorubrum lacusprofundi ATCC 49239]MCG1006163.1 RimK/LysX family protein [Halorubrum lacusprofundi]